MDFSLVYLAGRFLYRIREFIFDWYVGSFRRVSHAAVSFLERLDQGIAWRITLRNLFQPMYQDRSIIGRILGLFFRSGRLSIGSIIYAVIIVIALAIYILWDLIPIYIIWFGFFLEI